MNLTASHTLLVALGLLSFGSTQAISQETADLQSKVIRLPTHFSQKEYDSFDSKKFIKTKSSIGAKEFKRLVESMSNEQLKFKVRNLGPRRATVKNPLKRLSNFVADGDADISGKQWDEVQIAFSFYMGKSAEARPLDLEYAEDCPRLLEGLIKSSSGQVKINGSCEGKRLLLNLTQVDPRNTSARSDTKIKVTEQPTIDGASSAEPAAASAH